MKKRKILNWFYGFISAEMLMVIILLVVIYHELGHTFGEAI